MTWFARCAAVRRTHDEMWAPERALESDGLSRFQHRTEASLRAAGYSITAREIAPLGGGNPDDLYVTGIVEPSGARLFLYQDGVELRGENELRLEDWDVSTPDDMISAILTRLGEFSARAG